MQPVTVRDIQLFPVALPFVERLRTSFGEEPFKTAIIVAIETGDGITGWGEVTAETHPGYSSETMGTTAHVLTEFLVPLLLGQTINHPTDVPALLSSVRGHPMAKHGLEAAVWDAFAKTNQVSLANLFASALGDGTKPRDAARVGVSIGIKASIDETLSVITKRLEEGYIRIKLKIKPGWDIDLARAVRNVYPDIMLMLDANSAYTLDDVAHLRKLDDLYLLMLEQPLAYTDIYQHSKLQAKLQTAVCLDESILSANDVELALELGACQIINLKPSRVGGFTESLKIYKICIERDVPLWIGGMMETGVGRAANLALASLPGVNLPCDISATSRYFTEDIVTPPFVLGPKSTIAVPSGEGIGVDVLRERITAASALWAKENPYHANALV